MPPRVKKAHGQLRRSQIVRGFGPGAMIDLPDQSILVSGLEHWRSDERPIHEPRLLAKLEKLFEKPGLELYPPPIHSDEPGEKPNGITAWLFPEWFVAQLDEASREAFRTRRLLHRTGLVKNRYLGPDKRGHPVVPIRFVQACLNGHISDLDWYRFVHGPKDGCRRYLWLDERGTSGDLADVFVRCDCGQVRSLATATLGAAGDEPPLGFCQGKRPWLGPAAGEKCGGSDGKAQPNRLLVRSASNAYFAQTLSVLSIPDADSRLRRAVGEVWEDFLQYVESLDGVASERRKLKVSQALEGLGNDAVWAEIERRRQGLSEPSKSIKQAELEMLLASSPGGGEDVPDGDFYARALPLEGATGPKQMLSTLVRVDRLREVIALVGFTRFEAAGPDIDGELDVEVRRAPLSLEPTWFPAIENRGEGIFLGLRPAALERWLARPEVVARGKALEAGFAARKRAYPSSREKFPGLPYILLHSLSHLLLSAIALECGYAATSIRERIYAGEIGSGILLYTGTQDSEGTLGGLAQVAGRIDRHLDLAIELGRLCSNDPVCAQHEPQDAHEERFLHGAACHGCLLIAEPSCERRNEWLDRALVVETLAADRAAFFEQPPA